jgi:hypothetical protein
MSLSSDVKNLENICTAYGKVFFLIKQELESRGFNQFDKILFSTRMEYFKDLHLNMALCYCPFPEDCSYYERCTEKYCGADICDNGFPRKGC